jgi:hypothetical protein
MYGISEKELIANQGKITPEQQIKNLNELRKKALVLPFDIESVDPFCNACVLAQLDKYDKFVDHSGNRSHGKFQINCEGINIDILDENLKSGYSEEEWDQLKAQADIVYWAKKYLKLDEKPWTARWYQEPVLRCTSKRKALRVSRRAGKTSLVCIEIVYYLFTNKNIKIIIAGPQKVHTEEIIKRTRDLIQSNPELANCIVKDIQAPYYLLRLSNGSELRGFAAGEKKKTGGTAVRGQDADRLYLEEMQYISEEAILGAVYPILQTHPDTFLVGFSTPNSMRTPFYSLCKENPMCKEFHYTYRVLPHWKAVEADRGEFTEIKWNNEFEAEFGESEAGVYKPSYIDASMQIYKYSDYSPTPGWKYCIGTDWNEKYGTEIVVLGWSPFKSRFIVVDTIHIEPSQFTQLDGINKLLDLNRKWLPEYIYIDSGNGSTNSELLFSRALKARGIDEPTARLLKTLKKYDSGASILTKDPLTKQDVKKPAKAFMVNASVRAFEQGKIIFSAEDTKLEKQLRNYIIERYTPTGNPVFGLNEEAIGDHRLDALNLAIVAFHLEFDDLYKAAKNISMEVYSAPDPRSVMQQILRSEHSLTTDNNPQNRRLEDPNISVSNYLAGINIPGKIDKTLILKTNRLGWDTDEEEKYSAIARQRKNSRLKLSRNRPQRTNF